MLRRNLAHEGVVGGKRVLAVGQPRALVSAVQGDDAARRWSM
jgi:hypothetical protein